MRVLLVEDDPGIARFVAKGVVDSQFSYNGMPPVAGTM
jgi:DNA-binding response OmpR family regulator